MGQQRPVKHQDITFHSILIIYLPSVELKVLSEQAKDFQAE